MLISEEQHIENLLRHINLVREAGILLWQKLLNEGRNKFGREVLERVFKHDNSKFVEEFELFFKGNTDKAILKEAIKHHQLDNRHHPEGCGGFSLMRELDCAEMSVDIYARAQEFGTCVKDWINEVAIDRYNIDLNGQQYRWLMDFINMLTGSSFEELDNYTESNNKELVKI